MLHKGNPRRDGITMETYHHGGWETKQIEDVNCNGTLDAT